MQPATRDITVFLLAGLLLVRRSSFVCVCVSVCGRSAASTCQHQGTPPPRPPASVFLPPMLFWYLFLPSFRPETPGLSPLLPRGLPFLRSTAGRTLLVAVPLAPCPRPIHRSVSDGPNAPRKAALSVMDKVTCGEECDGEDGVNKRAQTNASIISVLSDGDERQLLV